MNRKYYIALIFSVAILALLYFANKGSVPEVSGYVPPRGSDGAVKAALLVVREELGVPMEDMVVAEVLEREWVDTCLGVPVASERCEKKSVKGYEVTLETEDMIYVVRTNKDGSNFKLMD